MSFIQFQLRRGASSDWTAANPTLAQGELVLDLNSNRLKIGDGATPFNGLGYLPVGSVSFSGGTSSGLLNNLVFSNSNNVSFGLNGSTLTASVAAGGGGITNVNLSAGTTSQNLSNLVFSNSNGVTFGLNGSTVTASVAAGGGGLTNVNVSAGTTSQNLSNFVFSNSNGVSFGLNGSTVTGSHNGLTSQSNQALSGSNGSFAFQTATFGNLNGLSFYTSNGSMVASYTVPSVPAQTNQTLGAYAVSNTTQSSSGTFDARSFSIQGAGGVSVGVSNGSVIISGATGGGGGGITNVNLSAGTTSQNLSNFVFSNSNGVSFGLNGSTITASAAGGGGAPGISFWANYKDLGHVTRGVRFGGGTFWNNRPIFVPGYVEGSGLIASRIRFHIERSSNSTLDLTWAAGIYSVVNFSSLSLMGSSSAAFSLTNNTQWNNVRILDVTGMSSLTVPQGHIVVGMHISAQSASTNFADFNFYGANRITPTDGFLFAGTNSTGATSSNRILYPFHAAYSTTSAGLPANVVSADLQHGSRINEAIDIFGSGL